MQEHRPDWYPIDRPVSIEDDLPPLVVLHDLLRTVGLLRPRHGVLRPTRAAGDDLEIVRRIRSAFDPHAFDTEIIELTVGVLAAYGPLSPAELAPRVHQLLGYGWQLDGRPLDDDDVRIAIGQRSRLLRGLDLIAGDWRVWSIGSAGLSLLPRATMLADSTAA
jgi:hypothetical protein